MVDLGIFANIVNQLNYLGFYGFILPWLLVFALTFGLMKRSKVFGDSGDRVAAVVAMALAFFITAFTNIGNYFVSLSGLGGMLFGALLVVVMFFALLGFKPDDLSGVFKDKWPVVGLFALLALIIFFVLGGGYLSGIAVQSETIAAVFLIIVVAVAVIFVTK